MIAPLLVYNLINYIQTAPASVNFSWEASQEGLQLSGLLIFQQVLSAFIVEHTTFMSKRIGKRSEMAMTALIYKKLTLISPATNKQYSSGQISNFVNQDCRNIQQIMHKLVTIVQIPVYISFVVVLNFRFFGVYFLSGVSILALAVATNMISSWYITRITKEQMVKTDSRISFMSECISGMRFLKLSGWLESFRHRLDERRDEEVTYLRQRQVFYGVMRLLMNLYGTLMPIVTFMTFLLFSG